jgi:hypothetical protein
MTVVTITAFRGQITVEGPAITIITLIIALTMSAGDSART